jgi:hypothetical protein
LNSRESNRPVIWIIAAATLGVCLIFGGSAVGLWYIFTKTRQLTTAASSYVQAASGVPAPTGQLVLSQTLDFSDGDQTMQGSSFLARTPGGSVVIVTAAHFLDFEGPALERLSVFGEGKVATSTVAFGPPGNAGEDSPTSRDYREDYLLLLPETEPVGATVLEMDERARTSIGEKVWLPDLVGFGIRKQVLWTGTVADAKPGYVAVLFDSGQNIQLMGASGSPVISQRTGKVIGLLSRGGELDGDSYSLLTPAPGILKAMREAERSGKRPRLRECVGKNGEK